MAVNLEFLDEIASKVGIDYKSTRLSARQQKKLLMEWLLLSDVKPFIDICRTKIDDSTDGPVKRFWQDVYRETNQGNRPLCLLKYFDKRTAQILLSGFDTNSISDALTLVIENTNKGISVVWAIHKPALLPIIYVFLACLLAPANANGYDDALQRWPMTEWPLMGVIGYRLNEFIIDYAILVVIGYVAACLFIDHALKSWVSPYRDELDKRFWLFKAYRYGVAAEVFGQISMLRKTGMTIHNVVSTLHSNSTGYISDKLACTERLIHNQRTPYAALCEVGFLDRSDNKIVLDTMDAASDKEFTITKYVISTYAYQQMILTDRLGKIMMGVFFAIAAAILLLTYGGQNTVQMSSIQGFMLRR